MGKKSKKNENAAMPMFQGGPLPVPPVPFAPPLGAWKQTGNQDGAKDDASEKKENIKSTVKSFWQREEGDDQVYSEERLDTEDGYEEVHRGKQQRTVEQVLWISDGDAGYIYCLFTG